MAKDTTMTSVASSDSMPLTLEASLPTIGNGWTPGEARAREETSISGADLVTIIMNEIPGYRYLIIDCRFPYEYNGGHIIGAVNIYTLEALLSFLKQKSSFDPSKLILIFYCEFSSVRAPRMMKDFRNVDRLSNEDQQPKYPYCFLLEKGYSLFYNEFSKARKLFTKDAQYIPMHDSRFTSECCYYHSLLRDFKQTYTGINYDLAQPKPYRPFIDPPEEAESEEGASSSASASSTSPAHRPPPPLQPSGPLDTPEAEKTHPENGPAPSCSPSLMQKSKRNRSMLRQMESSPILDISIDLPHSTQPTLNTSGSSTSLSLTSSFSTSSSFSLSSLPPQPLTESFAPHSLRSSTASSTSFESENSLSTPPPSLSNIPADLQEQLLSFENSLQQKDADTSPSFP